MATSTGTRREDKKQETTTLPLHDRMMQVVDKHGELIQVQALSRGFVELVYWLKYRPARCIFSFEDQMQICANQLDNLAEQYRAPIDEWLARMTHIEQDLTKALRIPHNRFWSHAMYDDGFHQLLESYLRLAPRYTELHRYLITKEMEDVEDRVYKLVFRTFLRLSTYKESKVNHIDKEKFANLLYDNFIFDIPKIFDLCVLFQRGNHDLVCRMVENIMGCQQKYTSDLKDIEDTMLMAFERAVHSIQSDIDDDEFETLPRRLDDLAKGSELSSMPFWKLLERVTYTVDIAASLLAFFEVYPAVAKIFTLGTVGPRLAEFFDSTFPVLKEELIRRNKLKSFEPVFTMVKKRLSYAKTCILKVFRSMLQQSCLQPLTELGQEKPTGQELPYLESFFEVICNCLTEKHFIFAYQQLYPVEEDIGMFEQFNFFVDNTRVLYVLQSICMVYVGLGCTPPTNLSTAQDLATKPKAEKTIPSFHNASNNNAGSGGREEGACGGGPSTSSAAADQSSQVQSLGELFPDMPSEFLQQCLEYYNNYEEVVMALLDNNLPPSLCQPEPSSSRLATLEARSIYDNDEFDILRRDDVDLSRIHIGKKSKTPKSLDEKGHDRVLKEVYEKYSMIHEDVAEDTYEDEYDDTYDSNDVGLEEPARGDELTTRRPFTVPRVLEPKQGRRNGDSRYDDGGGAFEEEEEWQPPRDQFVANPAEIRERREQRHREMMERKGGPPRQRNVRGGPRGRGQSRDVLRDRQLKERHGSAGHNQRAQADHKRSRGMYS
ncbi:activating signal cointegrator 1 complex subunit 2 isoform X1 [Ixodes scapularis]|uniref:activating signal cointegrator 1 complex subunit 2 isoform X1 n=2 Tax=Ixodes scapularis TaxID=6945 RepID=UPI001C392FFF|nr:activating signal cointegrator 1 complex subunit 2 isoform X1 [Ixodes scapularis]